jgi:hypothetical protein
MNIDAILAAALTFGVNEAEQYKPQVLAAAKAANVGIEQAADKFVDSLGGALSLFKGPIKSAIDNAITTGLANAEDALFEFLVSAARNEAAKLAAH